VQLFLVLNNFDQQCSAEQTTGFRVAKTLVQVSKEDHVTLPVFVCFGLITNWVCYVNLFSVWFVLCHEANIQFLDCRQSRVLSSSVHEYP